LSEGHTVIAHIDGGSRGNPGPAAAAGVLLDEQGHRAEFSLFLGTTTNNVAEYVALIWALEEARRVGAEQLHVYTDSQLLACQIQGSYRVKSTHLQALHRQARELERAFRQVRVCYVPREENRVADAMVNRTLDLAVRYLAVHLPAAKTPFPLEPQPE